MEYHIVDDEAEDTVEDKGKQKTGLWMGLLLLVVAGGVGCYWWMCPSSAKEAEHDIKSEDYKAEQALQEMSKANYVELPEMVMNLRSQSDEVSFLKCRFILLTHNSQEAKDVGERIPHIMDAIQSYIRELTIDQLEGALGIERVRQTLTGRINATIAPHAVKKILIKEFITQ